MSKYDLIKKRTDSLFESKILVRDESNKLIKEMNRFRDVTYNAGEIIYDIDKKFCELTNLNKKDLSVLFFSIALQCIRIYIIDYITKIETAGNGKREGYLHDKQDKILGSFNNETNIDISKLYHSSLEQIISTHGVPYDATKFMDKNYELFKGGNHRFSTLGHDPLLGLVFGTANILTNTITCSKKALIISNHVRYNNEYKNPMIWHNASTLKILKKSEERVYDDLNSVAAAFIKQIIHIGTDLYTPFGIHLPFSNLILSTENVQNLTEYIDTGLLIKVSSSSKLCVFFNLIISFLHQLLYDDTGFCSRELYMIKTNKIIEYSNIIATGSNIIQKSIKTYMTGDIRVLKEIDWGGIVIILHRIITDTKFKKSIELEFIENRWNEIVMGELY